MNFVNIGFGNLTNGDRIVSIISPDSAPAKRIVAEAKDDSRLIDATQGRRTKSVIILDSDHVVLSYLSTEVLSQKLGVNLENNGGDGDE